mmetsp:Transcript_24192/g.70901  ORF Transcript_24192/g.70901 Transcript_24192/m.70901 type:complete len:225 (-) Transcript_24192:1755-2429(-)
MQKRHVCVSCFRRVLHHVALVVALGELHVVLLHALALEVCLELEHRAQLDIEPLGDRVGDDALVCRVEDGDEQVEQHKVRRCEERPEEHLDAQLYVGRELLDQGEARLASEPDGHLREDARVRIVEFEARQLGRGGARMYQRVKAVGEAEHNDDEHAREAERVVEHRQHCDKQRPENAKERDVREQPQGECHLQQPDAKRDGSGVLWWQAKDAGLQHGAEAERR